MRQRFMNQLNELNVKILNMGAMVENIIEVSITALVNRDLEMAEGVYGLDDKIDELELEIEIECMQMLALQQPMAKDLRIIGTALKIITDLERIGDHAVNIARTTIKIGNGPLVKPLIDIPRMSKLAQDMVSKSLDAFMKEDIELARVVAEEDEAVDKIYEDIYMELIEMMIKKPEIIEQATHLLFIGRFLERIADHATNIGERVIYMVTGERVEIN